MFCKKCGAKLNDTAKFCTSCGALVPAQPVKNTPAPPPPPLNETPAPPFFTQPIAPSSFTQPIAPPVIPPRAPPVIPPIAPPTSTGPSKRTLKKGRAKFGPLNKPLILIIASLLELFCLLQLAMFFLHKTPWLDISYIYIIAILLCLVIAEAALLIINDILIKSRRESAPAAPIWQCTPVAGITAVENAAPPPYAQKPDYKTLPIAPVQYLEEDEPQRTERPYAIGTGLGLKITLDGEINNVPLSGLMLPCCIGRDAKSCAIVIPDSRISRRHVLVEYSDGLILTDLGSSNGTLVNGVAIMEPTRISESDTIKLGRAEVSIYSTKAVSGSYPI